jgi:hypothetical protein
MIQKFNKEIKDGDAYSERENIIVMTDEAHRTQYGTLAMNMRDALPNASFIGFTGTPLFTSDEITQRVFGGYISTYDFQRAIEDNEEQEQTRIIRPRTIAYGAIWVLLFAAFAFFVEGREPLTVDVGRVTGAPFTVLKDDTVANRLRFRLRNQSGSVQRFHIEPISPEGVEIKMMGASDIVLEHGQMERVEAWIVVPAESLGDTGNIPARFRVQGSEGLAKEVDFRLLGPATQR